ncbi:MAG: glycerate kinase [Bryobacteraceae bacterium]|nr:glycerate kinase [Bryobacteraceae bacterium]
MNSERRMQQHALRIFHAAVRAADPALCVRRVLRLRGPKLMAGGHAVDLRRIHRIIVLGAGKASARMAEAAERVLGARVTAGLIVSPGGLPARSRRIQTVEAGHPVPDTRGVAGARRIAALAAGAGPADLVLFLISGGASALLPLPAAGVTLAAKQRVTRTLLACGANIGEINTVRKHLSAVKGGQLARLAHPARVITLALSDVVGDPPEVIGSGPTVADPSSFADALAILRRYGLVDRLPAGVRTRFEAGAAGRVTETPKPGAPELAGADFVLAGNNRLALEAAADQARELGYAPRILTAALAGEARDAARVWAAIALEQARQARGPVCLLSGGETTVTLRGAGRGGRNQEFALAAAIAMDGERDTLLLSAGTDGIDGPTPAAGAIATGGTLARARALGLDARAALDANDSYRFFDSLGGLVNTGPTGTNVMDLQILLRP